MRCSVWIHTVQSIDSIGNTSSYEVIINRDAMYNLHNDIHIDEFDHSIVSDRLRQVFERADDKFVSSSSHKLLFQL